MFAKFLSMSLTDAKVNTLRNIANPAGNMIGAFNWMNNNFQGIFVKGSAMLKHWALQSSHSLLALRN